MKKFISLIISFIIILYLTVSVSAAGSVPEKILESTDSVLRIVAEYDEEYSTGTGFVIKSNNNEVLIATNYHVVEGRPYAIYTYVNDEQIDAEIVAYTDQKDICILSLNHPATVKALKLSAKSAQRGDAVYAVGFPGAADSLTDEFVHSGDDVTITDGIVSAVRNFTTVIYGTPTKYLQISADINHGNSGGPLFNDKGDVIGITTLGIMDSQGIFGAIDIEEVKVFLEDNNISLEKQVNIKIIVLAVIVAVLTAVIVLILIFVVKSERKTSAEQTVSEEKSQEKSHKKIKVKIENRIKITPKLKRIIIAAAVLILPVLLYVINYTGLMRYAKSDDFGNKDVLLLNITHMHDPMLYDYIEAGEMLYNREYSDAKEAFEYLGNYLDAEDMVCESDYRYAAYLADYGDFDSAVEIYKRLGALKYKDSKEKTNEVWFRKATYVFEKEGDYLKAYQILSSLGDNKKYDALTAEIEEAIYLYGQLLYQEKDFDSAEEHFRVIPHYKDAQLYLTLIDIRIYEDRLPNAIAIGKELIRNLEFEDTKDVILCMDSIASEFLKGKWETKDGRYGFEIKEDYSSVNYMPNSTNTNNYYYISQNEWRTYNYSKNDYSVSFTLKVIDYNKIEAYCGEDNKVYTLYRQ